MGDECDSPVSSHVVEYESDSSDSSDSPVSSPVVTVYKSPAITFKSITAFCNYTYHDIIYVDKDSWNSGGTGSYHRCVPFEKADHILSSISSLLYSLDRDLLPPDFFANVRAMSDIVTDSKLTCENYSTSENTCQKLSFVCSFDDGSLTEVAFCINPSNTEVPLYINPFRDVIGSRYMLSDLSKNNAKKIIGDMVELYYKILIASSTFYFSDEETLIKFVTKYPIILNSAYEHLHIPIFDQIFHSNITFEKKNLIYDILTKKLHTVPFGKDLLVAVCESSRIIEERKHLHHGCGCCIKSDRGYYYCEVIDHLLANGYSMSKIGHSFLPIHVIMNECNIDYIRWYIEKYGTAELNTPVELPQFNNRTLKDKMYPTMMLFACRRTVGDDEEICKILEYLISLDVIDFSVKGYQGKTIYDRCDDKYYPKSKMLLRKYGVIA